MLSRLLVDKGVREYIAAARLVKSVYPNTLFYLAGNLNSNPASITQEELNEWIEEGLINYLGRISPVQPAIHACRYYVLPSFYREGVPRSVLEAMAMARPIITTDSPGCRETVRDGVNGFLVPPRNPSALAEAMMALIEQSDDETISMAQASLFLAHKYFDVRKINQKMISVMHL